MLAQKNRNLGSLQASVVYVGRSTVGHQCNCMSQQLLEEHMGETTPPPASFTLLATYQPDMLQQNLGGQW